MASYARCSLSAHTKQLRNSLCTARRQLPAYQLTALRAAAQGVLDRVARHSAQAAAGVLSVADKLPARVADTLVRRLGGRASLVGPRLAAGGALSC